MINEKLNVGDYIFTANGQLAIIVKVNKQTYSYRSLTGGYSYGVNNVYFNGIKNAWSGYEEWFKCDDINAKALELAYKKYKKVEEYNDIIAEIKSLIGKAKWFLEQIKDIQELEVIEDDE